MNKLTLLLVTLLICNRSYARIWMPSILSDNMVLQQNTEVLIWGWTTKLNETISIIPSWNNTPIQAKAHHGKWSLMLLTPTAGGPYNLVITGHEKTVIDNILIGEVWLASGQSNMDYSANWGLLNADQEIKNARFPSIRFFQIDKYISETPQDDLPGKWVECTPESFEIFSSVAYFFGRELHTELMVPVGLINVSWGGTPIEAWMKKELIERDPELNESLSKIKAPSWWFKNPGQTYNSMIHPLTNFSIAGCLWYQGESNLANAVTYYKSFPLLIKSWREEWKKDLPFYFVQIAPYNYDDPKGINAAIVRDAQLNTMKSVPNTGMVVINDIVDINNLHPINKQDVGKRLAELALAKTYNFNEIKYSGPIYNSFEIKKSKIVINFDYADSGLIIKGKTLDEFYIAGQDKKFYPAKAIIKENRVEVYSSKVIYPIAVRYAFSNSALPNLFNKENLPASAFRTDNWSF